MTDCAILVETCRNEIIESVHRGWIVVCDTKGQLAAYWGNPHHAIFPRSAIKPLQALPLIESGAAARFGLGERQIALACGSHGGEAAQVTEIAAWLATLGLTDTALECGGHWPSHDESARDLARSGHQPCALHNNCSGKHSGFLTTARMLGEDMSGYIDHGHPVQRRVTQALGEMMGLDMAGQPWGIDGCGIPTFAVPLSALAVGMARLGDSRRLGPTRAAACEQIRTAMRAHPYLVAGTGRPCTAIMRAVPDVVVKAGAEGVYAAALPSRGLGIALKIEDGAARAAEMALLAVLDHLGALDAAARAALTGRYPALIHNVVGRVVGSVQPARGLKFPNPSNF